jgi:hypothetical protein
MLPSLMIDQGPRSLMPVLLDNTQDYHKKYFLNASWTSESLMPIPSTCMIKSVKQRLTLCKVGIGLIVKPTRQLEDCIHWYTRLLCDWNKRVMRSRHSQWYARHAERCNDTQADKSQSQQNKTIAGQRAIARAAIRFISRAIKTILSTSNKSSSALVHWAFRDLDPWAVMDVWCSSCDIGINYALDSAAEDVVPSGEKSIAKMKLLTRTMMAPAAVAFMASGTSLPLDTSLTG